MRRLLVALPDLEFETTRAAPLLKLCAAGARYGWRELKETTTPICWPICPQKREPVCDEICDASWPK